MKNYWERIELCGEYLLSWQEQAAALAAPVPKTYAQVQQLAEGTIPGIVPGNYELDLVRAGLLADPFYGENLLEAEKLEGRHVYYAKRFQYTACQGTEPFLVFEGIDTVAEIYLNGHLLGKSENMLIPQEFPAKELLLEGGNELVVHIVPACIAARENKVSAGNGALRYNYETLRLRKAPHMFGWDIMPRLVSAGIFRPAYLEYRPAARFKQSYLMTTKVDLLSEKAELTFFYEFETPEADLSAYQVVLSGTCGGRSFQAQCRPWFTAGKLEFSAENVAFWWPKGYGMPALYDVTVQLKKDGMLLDECVFRTGIRTVHLERTGVTDLFLSGKFHFEVNGKKVFILGTNFVPIDAFHSRDRERLPQVMDLLEDIGCNTIRCWGGGVYEDEYLFERCDEMGILIWQDFIMACAIYPTDEDFCRVFRSEAETAVRRLRQHPSILLWSGDNECDQFIQGGNFPRDPNRNHLTRRVLQDVADFEDPARPYLPSSPFIDQQAKDLPGDRYLTEQHLWGPRDYFKGSFYKESLCNFASEIGYHGCPSRVSLEKFLPADKLWPWQGNSSWLIHAASPEVNENGSYAYRIALMAKQIEELFGDIPDTLEDFILASQISQAEAKKFFVEMFRLGQPRRTGLIWWNLIDGWPQFSDAVVDYYYEKKLAYHYIKQVQQPVLLAMAEPLNWNCELRIINDTAAVKSVSYTVTEYCSGKTVQKGSIQAPCGVTVLGNIPYTQSEKKIYILQWEYDGISHKNHYLAGNPPFDLDFYREFLQTVYIK